MPWWKCDDGFTDHPKVFAATRLLGGKYAHARVVAVFVEAATFCARNLTDGFLPDSVCKTLRVDDDPLEVIKVMARADVKLMHREEGGFRLNDFLQYNPSAEETKAKREKDRRRKQMSSARNPRGIQNDSARIPGVPTRPLIDQDQDPRCAVLAPCGRTVENPSLAVADFRKPLKARLKDPLLALADVQDQIRAALHARLDVSPNEPLGELHELAKDVAGKCRATFGHGDEISRLVDGVIGTRARRAG